MSRLAGTALALLMAAPSLASPSLAAPPLPGVLADAEEIPVTEWSAMAMGRTLVYRIDGRLWALEYYYPGSDRVALQLSDGQCLTGTWEYTAPYYCYHWVEQGTACFRHARQDGEIIVIESGSPEGAPAVQQMSAVTDIPLSCGADLTS